jgi:hypothetical protein
MLKKKVPIVLFAITALTLFSVSGAVAGGSPPPSLSTGFQLQNRSTTDSASVVITYYNASGTAVETDNDTINANASKSYYVPNVLGQPDGRYSAVVSSNQPLFALVNEVTASGSTPNVAATHSGFSGDEIGSPLYIPWVVCGYYSYNSMIAVQNAGSGDTTVTVEFYQSGQSTAVKTYNFTSVSPGESVFLDMTQNPYKTDLETTTTNGFYGSVVVKSTGDSTPLAAVLNDTNPTGGFLRSYNAVTSGSTDLVAAQVTANYYGYSSGITLQNPSSSVTANVVISFTVSGAATPSVVHSSTVPPSSAKAFYLPSIPGMPTGFNGTAVVHSSIPVIGIANHDHSPAGDAASYNMTAVSDAAQTVYMPQVVRAYYGYESGYQLWNVGPQAVSVACTFKTSSGATVATINHSIASKTAMTYYLGDSRGAALGTGFNGGASCTITSGTGGLIGIANFVSPLGGDAMQVYNQFYD